MLGRRNLVLALSAGWLLLGSGTMAGCRRRLSPQDRIRLELAALETAIEEKDFNRVRDGLSARFAGPDQMDRPGALALIQLRLRSRPAVHLLVRLEDIEVTSNTLGRVQLLVAMASFPVPAPEALRRLEAEFFRFDLQLAEEDGQFRVQSATWEPARLDDFLP